MKHVLQEAFEKAVGKLNSISSALSMAITPWSLVLVSNLGAILIIATKSSATIELVGVGLLQSIIMIAVASGFHAIVARMTVLRNSICIGFALLHCTIILFSYTILVEYGYLPTQSIIKFIVEYPNYSFIMTVERLGFLECFAFILTISSCVLAWTSKAILAKPIGFLNTKISLYGVLILFAVFVSTDHSKYSIEANLVRQGYLSVVERFYEISDSDQNGVDRFVLNRDKLPELHGGHKTGGLNIIFLRLEEISRNKFGLYDDVEIENTPFLKEFVASNEDNVVIFDSHLSNSGATDTSTTLIYTGLEATAKGTVFGSVPMMWDYANACKFETFMVIPFHLSWGGLDKKWASEPGKVSLGTLVDAGSSDRDIIYDNSILDSDITDIVLDLVESRNKEQSFFGIANYKLPHSDGEGVGVLGFDSIGCTSYDDELPKYECAIYTVDQEIGRLFSELKRLDLMCNTMIVIAPDHGAAQFKRKGRLDNYYQEVLSIPMIFYIPDEWKNRIGEERIENLKRNSGSVTQNLDILPTLLDAMNVYDTTHIRKYRKHFGGSSLFKGLEKNRWILSMNSNALRPWFPAGFGLTIEGKYKYIYFDGVEELYNVIDDPEEQESLLGYEISYDDVLYKRIQQYVLNRKNTKGLYVKKYPEFRDKNTGLRVFKGGDFKTLVGVLNDRREIVSTGKEGVLMFGPYEKLETGSYSINVLYTMNEHTGSKWQFGYFFDPEMKRTIASGRFEKTGYKNQINFDFNVDSEMENLPLEFVVDYGGGGELVVHQLEIRDN